MRIAFESGFEEDASHTLSDIRETAERQYSGFIDQYRELADPPAHCTDAKERRRHNKRGAYITHKMADWIRHETDQETKVGRKLNEKLEEIKAAGRRVSWEIGSTETATVTLTTEVKIVPKGQSPKEAVQALLDSAPTDDRGESILSNLTIENVSAEGDKQDQTM